MNARFALEGKRAEKRNEKDREGKSGCVSKEERGENIGEEEEGRN